MGVRDEIAKFGKDYITELALVTKRPEIVVGVKKFFENYSADDLAAIIDEEKIIPPPPELISGLKEYKERFRNYSVQDVAEKLFNWLQEARPDLAQLLIAGQEAGTAMWLYLEAESIISAVFDKPFNVPKATMPQKPPPLVRALCDNCKKQWFVVKEDAMSITRCPFCGEVQEVRKEQHGGTTGTDSAAQGK